MKLLDAFGRIVVAVGLWIFIAFCAGLIARPFWEAVRFGFNVWG